MCGNLSFCPLIAKRTEGHHNGCISLNLPVDLPTYYDLIVKFWEGQKLILSSFWFFILYN